MWILSTLSLAGFLGWLFPDKDKIVFEDEKIEGLTSEIVTPSWVRADDISLQAISKELGYSAPEVFQKDLDVFAERVSAGFLPLGWAEKCLADHQQILCSSLEDYFGPSAGLGASSPRSPGKPRPIRYPKKFTVELVQELQKKEYGPLVRAMPTSWRYQKLVGTLAPLALQSTGCPRNFSFALAREVEEFLSDNKTAWEWMDKLDDHAEECLGLDHPDAELFHFRRGMLEWVRGLNEKARTHFEKASLSQTRREEYRALFWLAQAQRKLGDESQSVRTLKSLTSKFPLSWYSLLASEQLGIDPLDNVRKNSLIKDDSKSGLSSVQRHRTLWWQSLILRGQENFSVLKYGEFVLKGVEALPIPGWRQSMARLLHRHGHHRMQIATLSRMVVLQPSSLNTETLKLLYPKPFYQTFQSHVAHLDTAIILGLARQESGFDPNARSGANAQGLMQILPSTAKRVKKGSHKKLYDYAQNIEVGSRYILKLVDAADGSVEKALAGYNAGFGKVRAWQTRFSFVEQTESFLELIPYRETRDYVPSILRNAYWYHRLFPVLRENQPADLVSSPQLKRLIPAAYVPSAAIPGPEPSK